MKEDFAKRKHPRLRDYDYSSAGAYFVTVCVADRRDILCSVSVGRDDLIPPQIELLPAGQVLDKYIRGIDLAYQNVKVEKYVIMPNHLHLLIRIDEIEKGGGVRSPRPTVHTVIRSLKTMVTRELGYSIFQASYYDHVIRDENDFLTRWRYIDENPAKWAQDPLYIDERTDTQ